jgi:hypothetical protein
MSADTQTVTLGTYSTRVGFSTISPTYGSRSDGTSNIYSGASFEAAYWDSNLDSFRIQIHSTSQLANSGWGGISFPDGLFLAREAASTSYISYITTTQWYWSGVTTSPWGGATSGNKVLTFTSSTGGYGFQVFNSSGNNILDSRTDKQTTAIVSGSVTISANSTSGSISCPGMTSSNTDEVGVIFYDEPDALGYGTQMVDVNRSSGSFTLDNNTSSSATIKYVAVRF